MFFLRWKMLAAAIIFLFVQSTWLCVVCDEEGLQLVTIAVAEKDTDGFTRFQRSARLNNLNVDVLRQKLKESSNKIDILREGKLYLYNSLLK